MYISAPLVYTSVTKPVVPVPLGVRERSQGGMCQHSRIAW
jgi:hypothetical protein